MVGYFHNNKQFSLHIAHFFFGLDLNRSVPISLSFLLFCLFSPNWRFARLSSFAHFECVRITETTVTLIHFAHPNTVMVIVNSCTPNRFKVKLYALFFFSLKNSLCLYFGLARRMLSKQASKPVSQQANKHVCLYTCTCL